MSANRVSRLFPVAVLAALLAAGPVGIARADDDATPAGRRKMTTDSARDPQSIKPDRAAESASPTDPKAADEAQPTETDVLAGLKSGQLAAKAEGTGDGRITLSITNRTKKPLRVVLPLA